MMNKVFNYRWVIKSSPSPRPSPHSFVAGRGRKLVCRNSLWRIREDRRVRARGLQGAAGIVVP
jgi:hypothetical protein